MKIAHTNIWCKIENGIGAGRKISSRKNFRLCVRWAWKGRTKRTRIVC